VSANYTWQHNAARVLTHCQQFIRPAAGSRQ
jgi:hypothetical protein